jgi:nucleoside phosphorylase
MRLRVGGDDGQGNKVDKILGQSRLVCVYITQDGQLRWNYGEPEDELPEKYRATLSAFEDCMHDIESLPSGETKKSLYMLLGKRLFDGLTANKPGSPALRYRKLEHKIEVEQERVASIRIAGEERVYDIAIMCAIHSPELEEVLKIGQWTSLKPSLGDPQTYHSTTWTTSASNILRVVVAAPNHMGLVATGALAAKMVWRFRPRIMCMTGIAAGSKSEIQGFGDILVPNQTFDYGAGKTELVDGELRIVPSPNPLQTNPKLLGRLQDWQMRQSDLDAIRRDFPGTPPKSTLQIHIGPLFSSPTVLATVDPIKDVMSHWRKLVGVEMEAHAIHRAASDTIDPAPLYLCMKSVCDFAEKKDDTWQRYAAFTSANLLYRFVIEEWETFSDKSDN